MCRPAVVFRGVIIKLYSKIIGECDVRECVNVHVCMRMCVHVCACVCRGRHGEGTERASGGQIAWN